jgi:virginiamycin A acetyltransferase
VQDDVVLASHGSVLSGSRQHGIERLDIPIRKQPGIRQRVTIGRDTRIGERTVIMADVGRHCVIGAGAVVVEPIPDFAIAVGVSAKVIASREDLETVSRMGRDAALPGFSPPKSLPLKQFLSGTGL